MMNFRQLTLAGGLVALMTTGAATAQDTAAGATIQAESNTKKLAIGDEAPKLDIAHWLKGEEVTDFEDGKVYVVEFWATWCGPCKISMPHITDLQKKYKDYNVSFIGISDEKLQTVFAFLKQDEWDQKTGYTIATDPDRSVFNDYMKAAGQNGIPTAFVVGREGEIEWIGHPMRIDPVIEAIAHNNWDREAFHANQSKVNKAMASISRGMQMITDAETAEDGYDLIRESMTAIQDDSNTLNTIAWRIATDANVAKRDLDLAMKMAKRASELTNNESGMILDTLARVHYEQGNVQKALEIQRKALEHAEEQFKADIEEWLKKYEAEAKKNG